MASERNIENLVIWQQSRYFVNEIYKMMQSCKDWGFRDQIQRAAVSIMNNIAEGSESGSDAKFINFLNISRGSCSEVRSMLYLCEDFHICTPEKRVELQGKARQLTVGIMNLILSLEQRKKTS